MPCQLCVARPPSTPDSGDSQWVAASVVDRAQADEMEVGLMMADGCSRASLTLSLFCVCPVMLA